MKSYFLKQLRKTLYVIPYTFAMSMSSIILNTPQKKDLSDVLWNELFGSVSAGEVKTIILTVNFIGAVFGFALLYGRFISDFFETSASVFFTRIENRMHWASQKVFEVWIIAGVYTILYLLINIWISRRQVVSWKMSPDFIWTIICLFGMLFPLFAVTALSVSWISIHFGDSIGVLSVISVVLTLELFGILCFNRIGNMAMNPLCYNSAVMSDSKLAIKKVLVHFVYLLIISAGLIRHIHDIDIWK